MTPDWAIDVGGRSLTERLRGLLLSLTVTTTADRESDEAEIELSDDVGELAAPRRGRVVAVRMGWRETGLRDMGEYVHDESEIRAAPRILRIRCAAADFGAASTLKAPRSQAWEAVTVGDIVAAVAARNKLRHAVSPALAAEPIPHIDQTAESDLHFLRRLARRYDATAKVASGRILFAVAGAPVTAGTGTDIPPVRIERPPAPATAHIRAEATHADESRYASVRARWRDVDAAEDMHVTAGSGAPAYDLRTPYPDEPQARAAATARLARLTRRTATLSLTVPGTPDAQAHRPLELSGWGPGLDATWITTRATHRLSQSGYQTELEAEQPT